MALTYIFEIPLYATKVRFLITKDPRGAINRIHKKHNIEDVYKDHVAGIMISLTMNMYHIIIGSDFLNYNTLYHEQHHLIKAIATDRGSI